MTKTNRKKCESCGAINRWYYKQPKFCLKCKKGWDGMTWIKESFAQKAMPEIDEIISGLDLPPNEISMSVVQEESDTTLLFFYKKELVKISSSSYEFDEDDLKELELHYGKDKA